jgi:hypothetical protein
MSKNFEADIFLTYIKTFFGGHKWRIEKCFGKSRNPTQKMFEMSVYEGRREPADQGDIEARDWYDDLWGWGIVYIDSRSGSVTLAPKLICASSIP